MRRKIATLLSTLTILTLTTLVHTQLTHAAIFNAPDILARGSGAMGGFGEILLSDPSSEGVEAHGRYGLSDDLNLGAIIGQGSKNKQFRLGGELVYNFYPDASGQIGISGLASAIYMERYHSGGLQLRIAPLVHKYMDGWTGLPSNVYASLPLYLEGRDGAYTTASQFVVGSLFDLTSNGKPYLALEAGIRIAKAESYVLAGIGYRFGELKFEKRESSEKAPRRERRRGDEEKEYRSEDFEK